jgi:hypothetical protein
MIETYFAKKEGKPMPVYPEVGKNPPPAPPAEDVIIAGVPVGDEIPVTPTVAVGHRGGN